MNVLVVDDEVEIADLIELYLKNEGYKVSKFYDSTLIMPFLDDNHIDLAVIDVMMPDIDGFELCQEIRKKYNFPVLMVTAKIEQIDKLAGLTIGADDYITKPFQPLELVARVKAQLRRFTTYNSTNNNHEEEITIKELMINRNTHKCLIKGIELALTPKEFDILWLLASKKNDVIPNSVIYETIWQEKYMESSNNTIMVHIRHIREKINEVTKLNYIETMWGVGYKIDEN